MPRSEVVATVITLHEGFGNRSFTIDEAAGLGVAAHRVRSATRAGSIVRLRPGIYRLSPHTPPDQRSTARVGGDLAVEPDGLNAPEGARGLTIAEDLRLTDRIDSLMSAGIPAVAGERTAARLWHVDLWRVSRERLPVVAVPRGSARRGPAGGVLIIERDIDDQHVVDAPGTTALRAVDPLLSALQVASRPGLAAMQRLSIVVSGMRQQVALTQGIDPTDGGSGLARYLDDPAARCAMVGELQRRVHEADLRGRSRLLSLISMIDPRLESVLECISWSRFLEAGIPLPSPQAVIAGASGRRWRVDFLFGDRVVGECDGAVKYADGRSLWREKKRQEDLEQAGYIVVRWTWEEIVYHPHIVLARIALALARAA